MLFSSEDGPTQNGHQPGGGGDGAEEGFGGGLGVVEEGAYICE